MAQSRKRRASMSPTRGQSPSDVPEHKKRKPNGASSNTNGASSSKPTSASRPVARSPGPAGSDSSMTLDGDTPPSKDKGKAVEKDPLIVELDKLRNEVAAQSELLKKRDKTLAAVTQTLTCQVCLELMAKPYALAPCGHVSCHACLVSWFTASHNDHDGDEQDPNVEWFSESGSSADGYEDALSWPVAGPLPNGDAPNNDPNPAHADAAPPADADAAPSANAHAAPPANVNAAPPANDNAVPPANGNPPPPPPPPPPPTHHAYPNATHRRKTCPHCRCVVRERPVQVYALKDLVGIIDPSPALQERDKDKKEGKKETDPWKGIFPRPKPPGHGPGHGGHNHDDDSDDDHPDGWPGFGGVFGMQNDEFEYEEVLLPPPLFLNAHHHHHQPPPPPPPHPNLAGPDAPPPFVDEEDGVRRCGVCLHELWHGECTGPGCGLMYGDPSEGSDAGEDAPSYAGGVLNHPHDHDYDGPEPHHDDDDDDEDSDAVVSCRPRNLGFEDPDEDADDDSYEGSFIDDGPRRWVMEGDNSSEAGVAEEEAEDDFIPGPSRRLSRSRPRPRPRGRQEAIVISSDEEQDENEPGPSNRARVVRGRRRIVDEDEDDEEQEVEHGVRSVDEGPVPRFDEHGVRSIDEGILALDPYPVHYDASAPSSISEGHSFANVEEDEDDGEVSYPWEEEENEDGDGEHEHGHDHGNGVHLDGDGEESSDEGHFYTW